jgi:hypothetical protein
MRLFARLAVASFILSSFISYGVGGLIARAGATQTGPTFYVNAATDDTPTYATDCTVSTNTDCGIDDAINAFNQDTTSGDVDTIVFASTVPTFTVTDPTMITNTASGVTLSIEGNGQSETTVSGNGVNTVFAINGSHVSISGLTITDGNGLASNFGGGAVSVAPFTASVSVSDDTISNNTSDGGVGGGIFVGTDSGTSMTDDTFFDNTALDGGRGGAVFISNDTDLVTMSNDTLLDNTATSGGGVYDGGGNVTMTNDTLSDSAVAGNGNTTLANSILDSPTSCSGPVTDGGYNVESDDSCGLGSFSVVDSTSIGLATSLAPNGSSGPETLAIDQSSSAFDRVPVGSCTITTDERGADRPAIAGESCDAGAFEAPPTFFVNAATDNTPTYATDCTVSTNTDCGIDDAINAFNQDATVGDIDTIILASTVPTFTATDPTTITNNTLGVTLSIEGNGQGATTVSGNDANTVFAISDAHVSISRLTITDGNGDTGDGGGAVSVASDSGPVTLNDDTISGNTNDGGDGGAIYVGTASSVSMTNDTFFDNTALDGGRGGAVFIDEDSGLVTMTNDTLLDNTAASGGGVFVWGGTGTMTNDTLLDSAVGEGLGGTVTIANSILDGPTACTGSITNGGYNVESGNSCGFGSSSDSTSIGLATSLAPNGSIGPETLAIDQSSSVFNEVPVGSCAITPDERGITRPGIAGESCDAGAYEMAPYSATLLLIGTPIAGNNTYSVTLAVPSDSPAPSQPVVITDSASNSCSAPLSLSTATSFSGTCMLHSEAGNDTVAATYGVGLSDPFYLAATSNTLTVAPAPAPASEPTTPPTQTITFSSPASLPWGSAPFGIAATASSGLNVSFTSETLDVCTVSGPTVSILNAGTCTIVATQDGNTQFQAAPPISRSFVVTPVTPGTPTIRVISRSNGRLRISLTRAVTAGGQRITAYETSIDGRNWRRTTEVSGDFVIEGLRIGTTYTVRVRALNDVGSGRPSSAVRVKIT